MQQSITSDQWSPLTALELKERQRKEREHYGDTLSLRVHRAISWLDRAEQCEDLDGKFVFLWISFNSAYANNLGGSTAAETKLFVEYIKKLVRLDIDKNLYNILWQKYPNAVRALLSNQYIYQPFWNHQNGIEGYENWSETFETDRRAAQSALAKNDTISLLIIIFNRLYTLRNQIMHGGATWNSSINRDQLRDATNLLGDLMPTLIEVMMNNGKSFWGKAHYPVVEG